MIKLKNKETGEYLGTISEEHLQYLIDELEEESDQDKDYWLNRDQIEIFKEKGADPYLVRTLEAALGGADEMEIVWEES